MRIRSARPDSTSLVCRVILANPVCWITPWMEGLATARVTTTRIWEIPFRPWKPCITPSKWENRLMGFLRVGHWIMRQRFDSFNIARISLRTIRRTGFQMTRPRRADSFITRVPVRQENLGMRKPVEWHCVPTEASAMEACLPTPMPSWTRRRRRSRRSFSGCRRTTPSKKTRRWDSRVSSIIIIPWPRH